jgi:hypothetical protein
MIRRVVIILLFIIVGVWGTAGLINEHLSGIPISIVIIHSCYMNCVFAGLGAALGYIRGTLRDDWYVTVILKHTYAYFILTCETYPVHTNVSTSIFTFYCRFMPVIAVTMWWYQSH